MNSWIFQASPAIFDLDGYLRAVTESGADFTWSVGQKHLAPDMEPGDLVFMWRAQVGTKEPSGVIATAVIVGRAQEADIEAAAVPFLVDPGSAERGIRVALRLQKHATNQREIIQRKWLMDDPILSSLHILRMPSGTNFKLSSEQAGRLKALWDVTGRDWTRRDSIAGLWAYTATYGGSVSKAKDSLVAEIAVQIGRAVTGVYNKVMDFRSLDPRESREGLKGAGAMDRSVWEEFFDPITQTVREGALDAEFGRLWGLVEGSPPSSESASAVVKKRPGGQGYVQDPVRRKAVELHAMKLAADHFQRLGYAVEDTSARHPFDLRCLRGSEEVRVEVKGTQSDGTAVHVTVGEVEDARSDVCRTSLFIVSRIEIEMVKGETTACGGTVHLIDDWRPLEEDLRPTAFDYQVPAMRAIPTPEVN